MDERYIECRLCGSQAEKKFNAKVIKYDVSYYLCSHCGLLQSEYPFWIEEAYKESISILDTGIFLRNDDILKKLIMILTLEAVNIRKTGSFFRAKERLEFTWKPFVGRLLDYGGGYGILVRLLRDVGIDAYWNDKYSQNLFAKGFECNPSKKYEVVTAFELFEHFVDPAAEIENIFNEYMPEQLVVGTYLYGETVPDPNWWYYAFETGQHIAFYNSKTLRYIADKYKYYNYSLDDGFHFFSRNEIDIAGIRAIQNELQNHVQEIKAKYTSLTFSDHLNLKAILRQVSVMPPSG